MVTYKLIVMKRRREATTKEKGSVKAIEVFMGKVCNKRMGNRRKCHLHPGSKEAQTRSDNEGEEG